MIAAVFSWLFRYVGWPGALLCTFYIYEEGFPGAHRLRIPEAVPIIGGIGLIDIPMLGDLTAGRVHVYAAQQVAAADDRCTADKTQMVSLATAEALAALLAQERHLRTAAEDSAEAARARAEETARALVQSNEALVALQADATSSGLPGWSPEEMEWLEKH